MIEAQLPPPQNVCAAAVHVEDSIKCVSLVLVAFILDSIFFQASHCFDEFQLESPNAKSCT
jgi:hypothetical protein